MVISDFPFIFAGIKNSNLLCSFTNSTLYTDVPGTQKLLNVVYWPKSFTVHKSSLTGIASCLAVCLTDVFSIYLSCTTLRLFMGENPL